MMRHFTVDQANHLLPRVERHLRDALFARSELRDAEEAFRGMQERVLMAGGSVVDREKVIQMVAKKGASGTILQQEMDSLEALGVQVKDLDRGLVDFPAWYCGQEVLLCWQFGESQIAYWHGMREGFAGRKPIDAAFLAGHTGDSEQ